MQGTNPALTKMTCNLWILPLNQHSTVTLAEVPAGEQGRTGDSSQSQGQTAGSPDPTIPPSAPEGRTAVLWEREGPVNTTKTQRIPPWALKHRTTSSEQVLPKAPQDRKSSTGLQNSRPWLVHRKEGSVGYGREWHLLVYAQR